jgi:scyllo-inositol 2-dehydrogenase (NAD+)
MEISTPPLKAALIGCGRIGAHTADHLRTALPPVWFPYSHADALMAVPEAKLVAVCDSLETAAQSTAEKFSAPAWFTDHEKMIQEIQPDILLIATRTEGRAQILEYAATHGVKGVHFEKPLARSLAECRQALHATEAAGVHLSYGTVRRCMDVFVQAKERLQSGALGHLRHVTIEMKKGELLWAHPHNFDLITFFIGLMPVKSVQASMDIPQGAFSGLTLDADPLVNGAFILFENNLSASISPTGGSMIRVSCDDGELTIGGNAAWLTETRRSQHERGGFLPPVEVPVTITGSGTQHALSRLAKAVLGQGTAPNTAAEILRSNALGLTCAWSAVNQGQAMSLEDVPADFTVTGRKGDLYA